MRPKANEPLFFFLEAPLHLIFVFAPLLFGATQPWVAAAFAAFIFLLLIFFPLPILTAYQQLPHASKISFCILGVLIAVQIVFSSLGREATFFEFLKWMAFAGVFALIQRLPFSSIQRLLLTLCFLGALETLYGFYQITQDPEKVLWRIKTVHLDYLTGTYFNRNHLAGLLELCLGACLSLFVYACRRKKQVLQILIFVLLLITLSGLLRSGSRMGMVSFALSFLIFSSFLIRKSRMYALLLTSLVAAAFLFQSYDALFLRFRDLSEPMQSWEGSRLLAWSNALGMVRDFPLMGTGLGTFQNIFPSYQSAELMMGWSHVHNDYLELMVELGVLGWVALLTGFGALAIKLFRESRSRFYGLNSINYGIFVGLGALSLHALTDFNWAIPANALLYVAFFGMAVRLIKLRDEAKK